MKTVQISHLKDFSKTMEVCMNQQSLFRELESVFGGYEVIAEIDCDGDSVLDVLEDAFEKSNHIQTNWLDGDSVKNVEKRERVRSSCSGDMFVLDGEFYLVDMTGFKHIDLKNRTTESI